MTMDEDKQADSRPLREVNTFSLLRRLSLSSLAAMLITAAVLIFLYRQDQIAEHNLIAAQANEHTLRHLIDQFGGQFAAFVVNAKGLDDQALKANSGVDVLLAKMVPVSEQPWLKLKIYDPSGKIILSSAKEEIGRTSNHPDWVAKALSGEVKSRTVFRDSFLSSTGEMHAVYVAKTYMPLNYAGKRIGVIKIYRDVSPVFERIQVNTIKITLAVFSAFTMLYIALFCAVLRADRAVAEWQRLIAEGEESLRESQLIAGLGGFVLDIATGLWKSSEVLDQLFGIDKADEHSLALWNDLVHPDDRAMMADYLGNEVIGKGRAFDKQFRIIRHNDQAERWMHGLGKLKYDALGHPLKLHGTLQDITERKQVEERIYLSTALLQQTQSVAKIGSWRLNVPHNELSWTDETYRIFGISIDTPLSFECFLDRVHPDDRALVNAAWQAALKGAPYHIKHRIVVAGETRWVEEHARLDFDAHGNLYSSIGSVQDITEHKAAEEEIRNLAFFDHLTHLPNRRLLMDRFVQAQASSARSGREGALLFIDLDNFKTLNDTLGHDMGDLLLQQVAQRLTRCIREGDTAARLGGDEFEVMLEGLNGNISEAAAEAEAVGNKILAMLNQTYQLATHEYHSTPSLGVTMFNGHLQTIEELLRQADFAMYQSKKEGRNTLRFFVPTR